MSAVTRQILQATQRNDLKSLKAMDPAEWHKVRYETDGDTVLHVAARHGYVEILKYFLETSPPNVRNHDDKTPLHEAAQFCHSNVIALLLEKGASVNALKRADWTPLMLACTKTAKSSYSCVQLLLKAGALVNLKNKDGWSALHLISRLGSVHILELLREYGLDLTSVANNGRSALHVAALQGDLPIIKIVIKAVPVDAVDSCGNTPLHESVLSGSTHVCDFLLKNGANIRTINNVGYGVMHLAASTGNVEMIRYLNAHSADVNCANPSKLTPLHCAAQKKYVDAYNLLIQLGAAQTTDSFGRLPSDYLK